MKLYLVGIGLLLLGLLLWGCSAVSAPHNITNAWSDSARRDQTEERILEGALGAGAAIATYALICRQWRCEDVWWKHGLAGLAGVTVGVLTEYAAYEFIFEPAGWGGHYWERSRRNGGPYQRP